ncbi:MAG: membrane protein insertase YidC [Phycisphaerales bacterium]|nr:membrane protein insertase YidC [Phycisphaerales bacterium]
MPPPANPARRAVLTAVISLIGLAICAMIFVGSLRSGGASSPTGSGAAPAPDASTQADGARAIPASPPQAAPAETDRAPVPEPAPAATPPAIEPTTAPTSELGTLRARVEAVNGAPLSWIGGDDAASGYRALLTFTHYGAGIETITLADHFVDTRRTQPYPIQSRTRVPLADGRSVVVSPLATVGVEIAEPGGGRSQFVDLRIAPGGGSFWRETAPGAFEAVLEAEDGGVAARLIKRYEMDPGSFGIRVHQTIENLSGRTLLVRWYTYGPADLPREMTGYSLDPRRVRVGKLLSPTMDPSRQIVVADSKLVSRSTVIRAALKGEPVWRSERFADPDQELVWIGTTARYFAFVVHPLLDVPVDVPTSLDKRLHAVEQVHGVLIGPDEKSGTLILQLSSPAQAVAPGGTGTNALGAYAGPLHDAELSGEALFRALNMADIVIYNLGGMCAPCTFQPLALALLWFLRLVEQYVVFDWALAIMMLVLVVRAVLHPVTRRSQIAMARFGKQMQALGPKQQALKEKYKDDPKALQQEMVKLMREEGVSFTGALGCLPMFLQTPVWIALYAMLYFNFELRHQPAFFGLFQKLTAGRWEFLADLSAPDHFITFGTGFNIPLISNLMGPISGINILPLVLGVVFYIQQKYMTPPTTAAMTPEMQQQQKIMKFMMVVMFPVFMYNAPSGLAIYFVTNSSLAIIESRWVRAHINQLDLQPPKKRRPIGVKRVRNEAPANPFAKHREEGDRKYKKRGG